jgi:hypothetical protein
MGLEGNLNNLVVSLRTFALRTRNIRPIQDAVFIYMRIELLKGYYAKGRRGGNAEWSPLKPKTIKQKKRKGYAFPKHPLIASGAMSLGYIPVVHGNVLEIHNVKDYLIYHETGTEKMAKRSSTFFSIENLDDIARMLGIYITTGKVGVTI